MIRTAVGLVLSASAVVASVAGAPLLRACPRAAEPTLVVPPPSQTTQTANAPTTNVDSAPTTPPSAATLPAPAAPPSAATPVTIDVRLAQARAAAQTAGWTHHDTTRVPGRSLGFVHYTNPTSPLNERLDVVGETGATHTLEASTFEIQKTKAGSMLWDLRGDGARFAVVEATECGANCTFPTQHVFEARGGAWVRPASVPRSPTMGRDDDHDGIPEFPVHLASLVVASCPRVACGPAYALSVDVEGLESWDGARFATDLRPLAPLYAPKLVAAQLESVAARAQPDKGNVCPLDALRAAAKVFVYSRLFGADATQALAEADKTMAGYSTATCERVGDQAGYLSDVKPWSALRAELWRVTVPRLTRDRVATGGGWK